MIITDFKSFRRVPYYIIITQGWGLQKSHALIQWWSLNSFPWNFLRIGRKTIFGSTPTLHQIMRKPHRFWKETRHKTYTERTLPKRDHSLHVESDTFCLWMWQHTHTLFRLVLLIYFATEKANDFLNFMKAFLPRLSKLIPKSLKPVQRACSVTMAAATNASKTKLSRSDVQLNGYLGVLWASKIWWGWVLPQILGLWYVNGEKLQFLPIVGTLSCLVRQICHNSG